MQARVRGLAGGCEKVATLCVIPGQGLIKASEALWRGIAGRRYPRHLVAARRHRVRRRLRGIQVPPQQAAHRLLPRVLFLLRLRALYGIDLEKIVVSVHVGGGRFKQVDVDLCL